MRANLFRLLLALALLPACATRAGDSPALVIAAVPDLQNYCSSEVLKIQKRSVGIDQLRQLTRDVIATKPDFVLQVGDLSDTTGGPDQNGVAADADDPDTFVTTPERYAQEMACVKENFFDALDAAGIPWLAVSGNHDSYRDFERALPAAAFLAKPYAYAVQSRVDAWHKGFTDTEQRAALFPTPIGPICAVGGDFTMDATDQAWVAAQIGCGASHPTISLRHWGACLDAMGLGKPENAEIFLCLDGHVTPKIPGVMQNANVRKLRGGFEALDVFTNSQEVSLACGGGNTDGTSMHTGVGWWTLIRVVPGEERAERDGALAALSRQGLRPELRQHLPERQLRIRAELLQPLPRRPRLHVAGPRTQPRRRGTIRLASRSRERTSRWTSTFPRTSPPICWSSTTSSSARSSRSSRRERQHPLLRPPPRGRAHRLGARRSAERGVGGAACARRAGRADEAGHYRYALRQGVRRQGRHQPRAWRSSASTWPRRASACTTTCRTSTPSSATTSACC